NFADLAHDIVTFKRSQFASSRLFEYRNAKLEQVHKRIRTRCPTAERLQLSTGRTNLANIPLRDFTRPQHSQKLTICLSPTFLAIHNANDSITVKQFFRHLGQLLNILPLYRTPDRSAAKQ